MLFSISRSGVLIVSDSEIKMTVTTKKFTLEVYTSHSRVILKNNRTITYGVGLPDSEEAILDTIMQTLRECE